MPNQMPFDEWPFAQPLTLEERKVMCGAGPLTKHLAVAWLQHFGGAHRTFLVMIGQGLSPLEAMALVKTARAITGPNRHEAEEIDAWPELELAQLPEPDVVPDEPAATLSSTPNSGQPVDPPSVQA